MKRRSVQLGADYPDIISKLSLYLGAGMSIRTAWGRITAEYRGEPGRIRSGKERRYAYEEMRLTWNELCIGVPEEEAFERFGQRIGELAYIRFGTLLAQNVRKGGSRLLELLARHRAALLDEVHKSEKKIDCLDYLIYRIKQNQHKREE